MKKIFTAMLALVAAGGMTFSASAQEENEYFDCFVKGEKVKSGDRINITDFYEELSLEGFGVYQRQYNTHLTILPYVEDAMEVTLDNSVNNSPLDENWEYGSDLSIQFCGFGGCVSTGFGKTGSYNSMDFPMKETTADKEFDAQTEVVVGQFGESVGDDFRKLEIKAEFDMKIVLDEQEMVLTFYIDQKGLSVGVEGIEADINAAPVYYDLQGRRVDNPSNGLYIVKKGSKVSKEFVR